VVVTVFVNVYISPSTEFVIKGPPMLRANTDEVCLRILVTLYVSFSKFMFIPLTCDSLILVEASFKEGFLNKQQ